MLKVICDYCETEITKDSEVGTFVHIKEKQMLIPGKDQQKGFVKEKKETHLCYRCVDKVLKALK